MLLACWGVFDHISGLKRLFLIKTIQIITSQIYLYKLQVANMEFIMPMQQQCLRYRELPVIEDLIDEGVISEISKAFMKELDVIAAR